MISSEQLTWVEMDVRKQNVYRALPQANTYPLYSEADAYIGFYQDATKLT